MAEINLVSLLTIELTVRSLLNPLQEDTYQSENSELRGRRQPGRGRELTRQKVFDFTQSKDLY